MWVLIDFGSVVILKASQAEKASKVMKGWRFLLGEMTSLYQHSWKVLAISQGSLDLLILFYPESPVSTTTPSSPVPSLHNPVGSTFRTISRGATEPVGIGAL
jgi:hypothetical protein